MMAVVLFPALVWYVYSPGPFVYFNLMGVSIFLMLGLFKLECRLLGFNPFNSEGIVLSPEVRQITLRVVGWFKRHPNVTPVSVLFLFLLFVGIDLGLHPKLIRLRTHS